MSILRRVGSIESEAEVERMLTAAVRSRTSARHSLFTREHGKVIFIALSIGVLLCGSRSGPMVEFALETRFPSQQFGNGQLIDWNRPAAGLSFALLYNAVHDRPGN
jgi:hypothetical protein